MSGDNIIIVAATAGEDLRGQANKGLFVYADSADSYKIKKISSVSQRAYGVLQANPQGDDFAVEVAVEGGPALVQLGGTINVGDLVTYDATGKTIKATAARQAVGVYLYNGNQQPVAGASGQQGFILLFGNKISQFFSTSAIFTSVTHNPASVGAGLVTEETITVTGAATGDRVLINAPSLEANLVISSAYVSAADTVKFRLYNPTGAPIDPASQAFLVTVWPAA
jgi:hypothetical protein